MILKPSNLASLEIVAVGEVAAVVAAVAVVEAVVPDVDAEYEAVPDAVPVEKFAVDSSPKIFDEAERKVVEATDYAAVIEYDMKVTPVRVPLIAFALTTAVVKWCLASTLTARSELAQIVGSSLM